MNSIFSTDEFKVLASLAVVIVTTVIFFRQSRHRSAADPKVVKDQLEKLGAEDYTVLSNVVFFAELGMNDVSHVVVSTYGVFVLPSKRKREKCLARKGTGNGKSNREGRGTFCITHCGKTASMSTLWKN